MKKWVIKRSWPNENKLEVWEFIDTEEEARKYWYISQAMNKYGVEEMLPIAMNDLGGYHSLHNIMDRIVKIVESDEKPKLSVDEAYGVNEEMFRCGWIAPNGTTYSCCSLVIMNWQILCVIETMETLHMMLKAVYLMTLMGNFCTMDGSRLHITTIMQTMKR